MSNQLGVAMINSIISLKKRSYSNREIARMLGIYRGTVNRYIREYGSVPSIVKTPKEKSMMVS